MKILKKIGLVLVMSAMLFGAVACGDGTGGVMTAPLSVTRRIPTISA